VAWRVASRVSGSVATASGGGDMAQATKTGGKAHYIIKQQRGAAA